MAKPVLIDLPEDQWVAVALNVTDGQILPMNSMVKYVYTIRDAGDIDVPTLATEGKELRYDGAVIETPDAIDVYVMAMDDDGKVRVDL